MEGYLGIGQPLLELGVVLGPALDHGVFGQEDCDRWLTTAGFGEGFAGDDDVGAGVGVVLLLSAEDGRCSS